MSELQKGRPQRGVSLYSYSSLLGVSMTLEDCFKDIHDTGATCVEILSSYIENYPLPSTAWVDNWWKLLDKYGLEPGGYGHWADTRLYKGRSYTVDEAVGNLARDFKLANLLGFKYLRTKITVTNIFADPEPGWDVYVGKALELAETYDVRMCSEIHSPTYINIPHIDEYIAFIERTGTKHFGFNVDFGTFARKDQAQDVLDSLEDESRANDERFAHMTALGNAHFSKPEDLLKVLPYTYYCHAKFNYVNEDFEEVTIPYGEVLKILVDNGWSGNLVSEYEGPRKDDFDFVAEQLRRQHIMMKRILGY